MKIEGSFVNSPITQGGGNIVVNNVYSSKKELDDIIKGIERNLSDLKTQDADSIRDIIEIVGEELEKPIPKVSRLRNCLTLMTPMLAVANGIPTLTSNLQKLIDYITSYIKN